MFEDYNFQNLVHIWLDILSRDGAFSVLVGLEYRVFSNGK